MQRQSLITAFAAVLASIALGDTTSADGPPKTVNTAGANPGERQRLLYLVRNGAATKLADVLQARFQPDATISALPEGQPSGLLISASPSDRTAEQRGG
jgi:hypothetical protein